MNANKNFPVDFTKEEIIQILSDLSKKIDTENLSDEKKINIERKMMVCQNHLVFLSLIDSNEKLNSQQEILVKQQNTLVGQQETLANLFLENVATGKRTAKEAKFIILLTILTILATSAIELFHMHEENENQKKMIKQLEIVIKNTETNTKPLTIDTIVNSKNINDTILK
jgi:hypothetical protein